MSDDAEIFLTFLNGIADIMYYKREDISREDLHKHFPSLLDADFQQLFDKTVGILKNIVSSDMDLNQLDAFLVSKVKRKESTITEQEALAYTKFWQAHRAKIHTKIFSESCWNPTLRGVKWRADMIGGGGKSMETGSITLELQRQNKMVSEITDTVVLKVDEKGLETLLTCFDSIEKILAAHAQL